VPNAALEPAGIDTHCGSTRRRRASCSSAAERLGWSGRGLHRALKVARTVADLAGSERIGVAHLAEAMQYRRSLAGSGSG
jgi:magnesium chelatase family protein